MTEPFDPFKSYANNPYPVFDNCEEVFPSDDAELSVIATTIRVETSSEAGATVSFTTAGGQRLTLQTFGGMLELPVRIRKIWATGTTAKSILAFW